MLEQNLSENAREFSLAIVPATTEGGAAPGATTSTDITSIN